jgi:hypothetical protein
MYDSYKNSTNEKLLEFMAPAGTQPHMRALSQQELAILYCEGIANSIHYRQTQINLTNGGDSDERKQ